MNFHHLTSLHADLKLYWDGVGTCSTREWKGKAKEHGSEIQLQPKWLQHRYMVIVLSSLVTFTYIDASPSWQ